MQYRLGLDVGANSIGWACLALDSAGRPYRVLDLGCRVYPDGRNPKDGASLAAARRVPRSMRRRRDRYLARRAQLLAALQRFDLMPADAAERQRIARTDPYAARQDALHRRLEPFELGRALFHINQRRGFKSNRRLDSGNQEEAGKIKAATARLAEEIQRTQALTLGDWLATRHAANEPVRVRLSGSGMTAVYPFYPSRALLEAEFDTIWQAQSAWNPSLTHEMRKTLRHIIFHQRPLQPVKPGKCWLEPDDPRAPRALPLAQRFRIAQTLAHLLVTEPDMPGRPLTDEERTVLLAQLYRGRDLGFGQIRKLLKFSSGTDFNFRDDKIAGDATAARLGGSAKSKTACIGLAWHEFDLDSQNAIIAVILESEDDASGVAALIACGLSAEQARQAIGQTLPDGRASLSAKAMARILPHLEAGIGYAAAVQKAGYAHHSDQRTGEIRATLPYYGALLATRIGTGSGDPEDSEELRLGRAPNPTVHIALNEIRRVVNAITARHGAPTEIVVETLRDLGRSAKQRHEEDKKNRENQQANDKRRAVITGLGFKVTGDSLMRLRLFDEQAADPKDRCCPYTGTMITPRLALSDAIEVDHILPFAQTLDDSTANRILVTREANRRKARRTPFQAFGHAPEWPDIMARAALLPKQKRWRFERDAEQKLAADGDFLARHLTDSATIARWTVFYLDVLAPGGVWSVPGRLTSLLRHELGLNSQAVLGKGGARKDRTDHRHHAIDAVVVALTDRGMLNRINRAAKQAGETSGRLVAGLDEPWPGFIAEIAGAVQRTLVSHKPDTGVQGPLHNDTTYGPNPDTADHRNAIVRKPVIELIKKPEAEDAKSKNRKPIVVDPALRKLIEDARQSGHESAQRSRLSDLVGPNGRLVRSVRMKERLESFQPIKDRKTGKVYKLVKRDGNHRAEFWRLPKGTYALCVVSRFDAAQEAEARRLGRRPDKDLRPHPAAKLLMRLHINDMVAFGCGPARRILRVVKMSGSAVTLADPHEGGALKGRDADKKDAFKYISASQTRLLTEHARKVWVDPSGRIVDPGPVA